MRRWLGVVQFGCLSDNKDEWKTIYPGVCETPRADHLDSVSLWPQDRLFSRAGGGLGCHNLPEKRLTGVLVHQVHH